MILLDNEKKGSRQAMSEDIITKINTQLLKIWTIKYSISKEIKIKNGGIIKYGKRKRY